MIPDWLDAAIERAKRCPYRADAGESIFGRGLTSPGLEDAPPSRMAAIRPATPPAHATFGWARIRADCVRHGTGRETDHHRGSIDLLRYGR